MRTIVTACLFPLALAACSAGAPGEDVGASAAAISASPVSGLLILPTDQRMVFSFTATGAAPVTIVDPNGDAQTQAAEVNTAGIASVLFTSLVACTQYTWSVTVAAAVARPVS